MRYFTIGFACFTLTVSPALRGAQPGILVADDPSKPPPFVDLPARPEEGPHPVPGVAVGERPDLPPPPVEVFGGPVRSRAPVDEATAAIASELRARVEVAHAAWVKMKGGGEFWPGLSYVRGRPVLMLVAPPGESGEVRGRRLRATLAACEHLLGDDAFEEAVICVVRRAPGRSSVPTTRNTLVGRAVFQAAVRREGRSTELAAAAASVRADGGLIERVCAELGLQ